MTKSHARGLFYKLLEKPFESLLTTFLVSFLIFAFGVGLLLWGLYSVGARFNTTRSIPVGLYWKVNDPIQTGSFVEFCPAQVGVFHEARDRGYISAGPCPGNYGYLMKQIAGTAGDTVRVTAVGVFVNERLVPFSAPRVEDRAGRPMPQYQAKQYVLGATELLLLSPVSATSFDGRYFGPVGQGQVRAVITPVFTW